MKKKLFCFFLFLSLSFSLPFKTQATTFFTPGYLLSDSEMTDVFTMSIGEIQDLLLQGSLATYITEDIDGKRRYAADIVWRAAQRNGINPKVILVMLQKEQSLITDKTPSQDQFDFAMGYGVCDSCSLEDPNIQRWRGFAKQINSATLQLSEGYLADLASYGETVMGYYPGQIVTIDGQTFEISNNATAALYTYTPHLEGNQNFIKLWQQWFSPHFFTGSLLQNIEDGGIWLIKNGERKPITSKAAYLSRYENLPVIPVESSLLNVYPIGSPVEFPNYSLLRTENGSIYLLVDDTLRHIQSMEAFRQFGFHAEELIEVMEKDIAGYQKADPITVETQYPQGALLQNINTGGVYYVENGLKHPIPSRGILTIRYQEDPLFPASPQTLEQFRTADPITLLDGTLVGIQGEPTVYVISEGKRIPILNESDFLSFGWKWEDIIWTDKQSVELHPL